MRGRVILLAAMAGVLVVCLAPMPYGFYTLVRFVAMAAFGWLAFDYFRGGRSGLGFGFAALALLFQPLVKVSLGRTMWHWVDVVVALALVALAVWEWRLSERGS